MELKAVRRTTQNPIGCQTLLVFPFLPLTLRQCGKMNKTRVALTCLDEYRHALPLWGHLAVFDLNVFSLVTCGHVSCGAQELVFESARQCWMP